MSMFVRVARTRTGRLALIAVVAFLSVAGVGVTAGLVTSAVTAGADRMLAQADPAARAVAVQYSRPADLPDPDADVRAVIERTFAHTDADVSLQSSRRVAARVGERDLGQLIVLIADDAVRDAATLVDGTWPEGAAEGALNERAASALDLTVGSTLTVGTEDVTVTGLWRARDDAATLWRGDPAVASGRSSDGAGPLLVSEAGADGLGVPFDATWIITPRSLEPQRIAALTQGLSTLPKAVAELDPQGQRSARVSGSLAATIDRVVGASASVAGAVAVPGIVTLLLGGIVLWLLVSGLAASRADQLNLMRARGASTRRTAGQAALESGLVALVGSAPAVGASALAGALAVGAAAAAPVVAFAAVAAALTAVRASDLRPGRRDAGTGSLLALWFPMVLVAVAAGLATAQLFARGGFVTAGAVDPASVAAPALLLVFGGLIVAAVAGPVAAVAARVAARGAGIIPALPLRRIARDATGLTAGVLCVALAAGAVVLSGSLAQGGMNAQEAAQHRTLAADMRVQYADESGAASTADRLAVVTGVAGTDDAVPAVVTDAAFGEVTAALVATDAAWIGLGDDVRAAVPLPEPAETMTLTMSAFDAAATTFDQEVDGQVRTFVVPAADVVIKAVTLTDAGDLLTREIARSPADGAALTIDVASRPGERVLGIAAGVDAGAGWGDPAVTGTISLTGTGGDDLGGALSLQTRSATQRFMVAGLPDRVPVAVTGAVAQSLGLHLGDEVDMSSARLAQRLPVRIVRIVPGISGIPGERGVGADLDTLTQVLAVAGGSSPRASEIWVRTDDADAVTAQMRPVLTERVTYLTPATTSSAPISSVSLRAVGAAAFATVLLAVIGFVGVLSETRRSRRTSLVPLRAVGMTPRRQRAADRVEAGVTALYAVTGGAIAGAVVAWAVVPLFAGVVS